MEVFWRYFSSRGLCTPSKLSKFNKGYIRVVLSIIFGKRSLVSTSWTMGLNMEKKKRTALSMPMSLTPVARLKRQQHSPGVYARRHILGPPYSRCLGRQASRQAGRQGDRIGK